MIIDCFTFFNELDILDIHLHELADHVDQFILIEARETFSGNPKALYYKENKERYVEFGDKITHIVLDAVKPASQHRAHGRQARMLYSAFAALREMGCPDDAIILSSDVDEVVKASKLPMITKIIMKNPGKNICGLKQIMFLHWLNGFWTVNWYGTTVATYGCLRDVFGGDPFLLRLNRHYARRYPGLHTIKDAGWHFCTVGNIDHVLLKHQSDSAMTRHRAEELDIDAVADRVGNDFNVDQRKYTKRKIQYITIDKVFPQYVQDNQETFGHLIHESETDYNGLRSKRHDHVSSATP